MPRVSALVFAISDVELDQLMRRAYQRAASGNSGFVRVRGLPYSCRREELIGFFKGGCCLIEKPLT